jgi:hypothetical protein
MRIGEIIETTSIGFVAESYGLHKSPPLGSLVKVELGDGSEVYAVVIHGQTASIEPGRRAVRWSTEKVYDERIYQEHPELLRTLRTEFSAAFVGILQGGTSKQALPPQPPPLHYSVHQCESEEVRRFTEDLYYLRLLIPTKGEVPVEQLLVAHFREMHKERGEDKAWLERGAKEISRLLKHDYDRLMTVLLGIEPKE